MNNNKKCPVCRSELLTDSCKKCGFKQNKIKIGQNQENFSKVNYISKITHYQPNNSAKMQITSQYIALILVKLKLYMKEYVRLMRAGVGRMCDKKDMSLQERNGLGNQVFDIWKGYLLKIKKLNLNMSGIFKKYIFSNKKPPKQQPPQDNQSNRQQPEHTEQKVEQKLTQQQKITYKRQRRKNKTKKPLTATPISTATQFRSYYITTVKPLIIESQQQRTHDNKCLTNCQKHFLSYLMEMKDIDDEFLELASNKYVKLLQVLRKQNNYSYLRQKQIEHELRQRNGKLLAKKEHSLLLILLIDIITCLFLSNLHLQSPINLPSLLQFYQSSSYDNEFINKILLQLSRQPEKDDHNIPTINYELIYAIIYIGCLKIGKCFTISQVLYNCGVLEIEEIVYSEGKQDVVLPAIRNEEYISCSKIRRTSHLLKQFLSIELQLFPFKWSQKWCIQFKIQQHIPYIQYLNHIILTEISLNRLKGGFNLHEQMLNNGKIIKYIRCIELQQDIACLAGIMVYLKLSHGLTIYPYLLNTILKGLEELCQQSQVDKIEMIKALLQHKKITIKTQQNTLIQKHLPTTYQIINLVPLSQTLTNIITHDKEYSLSMLNKNLLKITKLSDLNSLNTNQLLLYLDKIKASKLKKEENNYEIILRYNDNNFKRFCREGKVLVKRNKKKEGERIRGDRYELNEYLIRQMQVIKKPKEEWIKTQKAGDTVRKEECLVDYPSSNYELMLEYTNDNLIAAQRQVQLHFMQLLSLNLCTYNELSNWLTKYQSILKPYQI